MVMQKELSAMRSTALAANNISGLDEDLQMALNAQEFNPEPEAKVTAGLAGAPVPPSKLREILSLDGGNCLDFNPSQSKGILGMWGCHRGEGGPYQYFSFTKEGHIRTPSDFCADATGLKLSSEVKMSPCSSTSKGQRWTLVAHAPHTGLLRNDELKLCLFADKENKATLHNCNEQCGATWEVSAVDPAAPVESAAPGKPIGTRPQIKSTKGGRILCWVLTQPKWHATKATAVNNTWGKDCDILFFASSEHTPGLEVVVLDLGSQESRSMLWPKSQQMWMYVYQHYLDKADWFIKADDDTYIVFPYLREYLATLDTEKPIHLGRRLHLSGKDDSHSYYSGGAGIILSRDAVRRLGERAAVDANVWEGPLSGPEDYLTSRTLRKVGVNTMDTRDGNKQRFISLGLDAEHNLRRANTPTLWFWKFSKDAVEGMDCCSTHWVTTHYITAVQMYAIDRMRKSLCPVDTKRWPYLEPPEAFYANESKKNKKRKVLV